MPSPGEVAAPSGSGERPRTGTQSLTRAFTILEVLADHGGAVRLSQLSSEAGLPPATSHRLLRALVELGYACQDPSRQYRLGPRLTRLADTSTQRLGAIAAPHLDGLRCVLEESVTLEVLDGDEVVCVAEVQPTTHLIRVATEVGYRVPAHVTAAGRAILAAGADSAVVALLERTGPPPRRSAGTPSSTAAVLADLAAVRELGYALDDGEQEVGVRCVAAAVPGAPRPMAVSVCGPATRVTDSVVVGAAPLLHAAAARLAEDLSAPLPGALP